jgi:hypothetical protein
MATPYNAPYKKRQRKAKKAMKNRGNVLWVSCEIVKGSHIGFGGKLVKRAVQGTYVRKTHGPLGA